MGSRRVRSVPLSGRRPGRFAHAWTPAAASIWRRSPTSWTPRRCATAPAASCSPTRPRRLPTGCPGAPSCWPVTAPRRWRWPGTAARSCCESRTRRPRPTGLADAVVALRAGSGLQRRWPTRWTLFSTTTKSTDRCRERLRVLALTLAARAAGGGRSGRRAQRRRPDRGRGRARSTRRAATARCEVLAGGRPSSNWRCWPSGWRWPRSTCDWCGDEGRVNLLRGAVRTYAWGSRTAIAEFTGRPVPTAHPEAELWFGAHPGDPAWLETDDGRAARCSTRARRSRRTAGSGCATASATCCRSW